MKENNHQILFGEFPEISTRDWMEKIMTDLRGADFDKTLVRSSNDGITVRPFYRAEDLEGLEYLERIRSLRKKGPEEDAPNHWLICQDITVRSDGKESKPRIRRALRGGADALRLHLEAPEKLSKEILSGLLENVPLEHIPVYFSGFLQADRLSHWLPEIMEERGLPAESLKGTLGADPLGVMITRGIPVAGWQNLKTGVEFMGWHAPGMEVIEVNGTLFRDAGSTGVQELAFALAMGSEYLARLTEKGLEPATVARSLRMHLSSGPNYFIEIARLRAARILWERIAGEYGVPEALRTLPIHATSVRWNLSLYDPYVNMLRGTTEAMSAILGGADSVSVLPFDYAYGYTTDFSERIARSAQIILKEESYFDRVADPSAGSYHIESLTHSIAETAWELFRETEAMGGFIQAVEKGWIQEQVHQALESRKKAIATGKESLVGVNKYPHFEEMILDTYREHPLQSPDGTAFTPLVPFRAASLFESVRLETERSGRRPRVFLFKYGSPAWMTSRAIFAGNFFACAGYRIIEGPGFNSLEEGIREARLARANVVVICSADEAYPEIAPVIYNELRSRSEIVVAGYPEEAIEELKNAGIRHFIHRNSPLLETLKQFNRILLKKETK